MTERVFVDTNVVVYAADPAAPRKQRRAAVVMEQVFASPLATISTQVMQEFYAVATRGSRPRMKHDVAEEVVRDLSTLRVVLLDAQSVLRAVERSGSRSISIWDALIVQSAVESACTVLLTEDLTHGEEIDGVRVVDPFQGDEQEVLALFA